MKKKYDISTDSYHPSSQVGLFKLRQVFQFSFRSILHPQLIKFFTVKILGT